MSTTDAPSTPPHGPSTTYELTHLQALEAEAIHIIREVAAEFERPVMLFSGGKDSAVMLHLAVKAFAPARLPFPVMHIDTGHNFSEVIDYRDRRVAELGARLVVASVQHAIDAGKVVEETGPRASRNRLQTVPLLEAIEENRFDAVFGGARRDEEKARAKERVFSFRDEFGQWDPKNQRPELWSLYNGRHRKGEHIRVFPISNWTEIDIWQYMAEEGIELPSIYFAHTRRVFERDGMWLADTPFVPLGDDEEVQERMVRFRTVGDTTCTGAVDSPAANVATIIEETAVTRVTERGATRADDRITRRAWKTASARGTSEYASSKRLRSVPCQLDAPPVASLAPSKRAAPPDRPLTATRSLMTRWICCVFQRPARSTTASPPSSAGCCTTRRRSSKTSSRRSSAPAASAATSRSTWPC